MVFGLGSKKKAPVKPSKGRITKSHSVTKKSPKSSQANEAAEMLKKMEAKKAAGACPFC